MRYPGASTPLPASPGGLTFARVILLCTGLVFLAACSDTKGPEAVPSYTITAGACGKVIFAENLGADSASAVQAVEARKAARYRPGKVALEATSLEVVDRHGNAPEPKFYALHVLAMETGSLEESVSDVITTKGDLFMLQWCSD